jgi:hypothetical protein
MSKAITQKIEANRNSVIIAIPLARFRYSVSPLIQLCLTFSKVSLAAPPSPTPEFEDYAKSIGVIWDDILLHMDDNEITDVTRDPTKTFDPKDVPRIFNVGFPVYQNLIKKYNQKVPDPIYPDEFVNTDTIDNRTNDKTNVVEIDPTTVPTESQHLSLNQVSDIVLMDKPRMSYFVGKNHLEMQIQKEGIAFQLANFPHFFVWFKDNRINRHLSKSALPVVAGETHVVVCNQNVQRVKFIPYDANIRALDSPPMVKSVGDKFNLVTKIKKNGIVVEDIVLHRDITFDTKEIAFDSLKVYPSSMGRPINEKIETFLGDIPRETTYLLATTAFAGDVPNVALFLVDERLHLYRDEMVYLVHSCFGFKRQLIPHFNKKNNGIDIILANYVFHFSQDLGTCAATGHHTHELLTFLGKTYSSFDVMGMDPFVTPSPNIFHPGDIGLFRKYCDTNASTVTSAFVDSLHVLFDGFQYLILLPNGKSVTVVRSKDVLVVSAGTLGNVYISSDTHLSIVYMDWSDGFLNARKLDFPRLEKDYYCVMARTEKKTHEFKLDWNARQIGKLSLIHSIDDMKGMIMV